MYIVPDVLEMRYSFPQGRMALCWIRLRKQFCQKWVFGLETGACCVAILNKRHLNIKEILLQNFYR